MFTTVPSMNAMLEPRMVAAKIHGPFTRVGCAHRLLRIAASSQGGLAMVAMHLLSAQDGGQRNRERSEVAKAGFSGVRFLDAEVA